MTAGRARAKGVAFERQVAAMLEAGGWTVRGLEAGGDHLAIHPEGTVVHVEAKRQERVRLPEWLDQQARDCPPGIKRMLVFKQSRRPVYAVVPLEEWLEMTGWPEG